MPLNRKAVMKRYGISRRTIDREIAAERLKFDGSWAQERDVLAWAEATGRSPLDFAAQAEADKPVSGGGLMPQELLNKVGDIHIPQEYVKAAMDGHEVSKSLIGIIKAQEGQLKMFKESGRLADLNESQSVLDSVISALVTAARGLPKELAADSSRRHKLKAQDAALVLGDASDYLIKVFEAARADLGKRVQSFQDQKAAELKQRRGNKS